MALSTLPIFLLALVCQWLGGAHAAESACRSYCNYFVPAELGADVKGTAKLYQTPEGTWFEISALFGSHANIPLAQSLNAYVHTESCAVRSVQREDILAVDDVLIGQQLNLSPAGAAASACVSNRTLNVLLPPIGSDADAASVIIHNINGDAHACCDLQTCALPVADQCSGFADAWQAVDGGLVSAVRGTAVVAPYNAHATFALVDLTLHKALLPAPGGTEAPVAPAAVTDAAAESSAGVLADEPLMLELVRLGSEGVADEVLWNITISATGREQRIVRTVLDLPPPIVSNIRQHLMRLRTPTGQLVARAMVGACPDFEVVATAYDQNGGGGNATVPEPSVQPASIPAESPPETPSGSVGESPMEENGNGEAASSSGSGSENDKAVVIILGVVAGVVFASLLFAIVVFLSHRRVNPDTFNSQSSHSLGKGDGSQRVPPLAFQDTRSTSVDTYGRPRGPSSGDWVLSRPQNRYDPPSHRISANNHTSSDRSARDGRMFSHMNSVAFSSAMSGSPPGGPSFYSSQMMTQTMGSQMMNSPNSEHLGTDYHEQTPGAYASYGRSNDYTSNSFLDPRDARSLQAEVRDSRSYGADPRESRSFGVEQLVPRSPPYTPDARQAAPPGGMYYQQQPSYRARQGPPALDVQRSFQLEAPPAPLYAANPGTPGPTDDRDLALSDQMGTPHSDEVSSATAREYTFRFNSVSSSPSTPKNGNANASPQRRASIASSMRQDHLPATPPAHKAGSAAQRVPSLGRVSSSRLDATPYPLEPSLTQRFDADAHLLRSLSLRTAVTKASQTHNGSSRSGLALLSALHDMQRTGELFLATYRVLAIDSSRTHGQDTICFLQDSVSRKSFVVKFFASADTFEREAALCKRPELRAVVPSIRTVESNASRGVTAPNSRYVFPPFIVSESGVRLDEWLSRRHPDVSQSLSMLMHVCERLVQLHRLDLVHRALGPSSLLWRPSSNEWSLTNFSCAGSAGEVVPLASPLHYSAPEVVTAYTKGRSGFEACPSQDMWSLGVIAYEVLSKAQLFGDGVMDEEVIDSILGRTPAPWDEDHPEYSIRQSMFKVARPLKQQLTALLSHTPGDRPTASQLMNAFDKFFSGTTTTAVGDSTVVASMKTGEDALSQSERALKSGTSSVAVLSGASSMVDHVVSMRSNDAPARSDRSGAHSDGSAALSVASRARSPRIDELLRGAHDRPWSGSRGGSRGGSRACASEVSSSGTTPRAHQELSLQGPRPNSSKARAGSVEAWEGSRVASGRGMRLPESYELRASHDIADLSGIDEEDWYGSHREAPALQQELRWDGPGSGGGADPGASAAPTSDGLLKWPVKRARS